MSNTCLVRGVEFTWRRSLLTVAKPRYEWNVDVDDPKQVVEVIQRQGGADLVTFAQRLPYSKPKFPDLFWEWDNVAAIPISTYAHWFDHQLHQNPRNKVKKAQKQGLEVRIVPFNDELILGIKGIQDEVPIRQGRPYVHYRKDVATVKKGYETFLEQSTFIGAFYQGELIGFLKLVLCGRFARSMGLLTKNKWRDLAPMNALIAKAVEICAEKNVPHLVYGRYDYGKIGAQSVIDFKFYNGFEHILLPRYYIPLTGRGQLALKTRLHNGVLDWMPKECVQRLRQYKIGYYEWRYRAQIAASFAQETKPA